MLVGTSLGLSHWDGQRWVSYGVGNGLPEGHITAVAEDRGVIWVGTWGGGLGFLEGGAWKRYRAGDSGLPGDWVSDLVADDEGLWIATYGRGLAHLKDDKWSAFTHANSGLPSDWLTCLLPDGEGGLWIGMERAGLAHLQSGGHWLAHKLPTEEQQQEVTDLVWRGHQLWVGTRRGVAVLDPMREEWHMLGRDQGLPSERITALAALPDGRVWIGTDQGLVLWDADRVSRYTVDDGLPHNVVSALAVDANGRTWVGSYVRGLATLGHLEMPQVARPPVVLVHGWRGPDSDLLQDSEFWHLARWLREDGFVPFYATGISPAKTLHENAARLREVISEVRREAGAPGVYLIAFSMGGLNARTYLESTLYQGDVLRAFIVGTPHQGEELWLPFLLWEYLAWTDEPSALELFPAQMELFNRGHENVWGVPYTLIAGDATNAELPTLFQGLPPSDGLVSTYSALGIEGPGVDRRITGDIHAYAEETILLQISSLLFPRGTYDAHIRPYLFGVADAPGVGSPLSNQHYTRPSPEPRSALRTGSVQPGETVALTPIPIDAPGRTRFLVRWKGPALSVSLRDPKGRTIDSKAAEKDGESEYLELGFADVASYVVTNTLPGSWTIMLHADGKNRSPSQYVAYASQASPARLQVSTDRPWYLPGELVTITVTCTDASTPISLTAVQADVYSPGKEHETIPLTRVQPVGEKRASPSYVASYRAPSQGGYYNILVRASGRRGKNDLERGGELTFGVCGDSARLSGVYDLAAGQRDGSGKLSNLEATIGVVAQREGSYLCAVALADSQGHRIATVAKPVHLTPGVHTLVVSLPGQAIAASGRDGPYHLSEVMLQDIAGAAILLDAATEVGPAVPGHYQDFAGALTASP
jgi:hypothetical protein